MIYLIDKEKDLTQLYKPSIERQTKDVLEKSQAKREHNFHFPYHMPHLSRNATLGLIIALAGFANATYSLYDARARHRHDERVEELLAQNRDRLDSIIAHEHNSLQAGESNEHATLLRNDELSAPPIRSPVRLMTQQYAMPSTIPTTPSRGTHAIR